MLDGPKDFHGLLGQLQEKSRQNPEDNELMLRLARLYVKNKDYQHAADTFCRILRIDSRNPHLMVELAHCHIRQNRLDDALYYLESAVAISPGLFSALIAFAKLYETEKNAAKQVHYMMLAANAVPDKIEVRLSLAEMLRKYGDFSGAIDQYQKILAVQPEMEAALFPLSLLLMKKNNLPEAVAALQRVLAGNPGAFDAHFNLANCFIRQKKFAAAINHLRFALRKPGLQQRVLFMMSQCFLQLKDFDQAIVTVEKLVEIDESNLSFHQRLAEIYEMVEDYDLARDVYKKMSSLAPDRPEYVSSLAACYLKLNDFERGRQTLERLFHLHPGHLEGHKMLGDIYLMQRSYHEAIEEYRRALMIKEFYSEALMGLGKVYRELGRESDEQEALKMLVDSGFESAEVLLRLGELERKLKLPACMDRFRKIKEIAPQSIMAREADYYLRHQAA